MNLKQLNEALDKVLNEISYETEQTAITNNQLDNIIISKRKLKHNLYSYTLFDIDNKETLAGITSDSDDIFVKKYFTEEGFNVENVKIVNEIALELKKELEKRGYTDKKKYRIIKREKDGDLFVNVEQLSPCYDSRKDSFIIYGINGQGHLEELYS